MRRELRRVNSWDCFKREREKICNVVMGNDENENQLWFAMYPFEGRLIGMMVKRSANTSGTFFEQFG
jgi:hypothetical protein